MLTGLPVDIMELTVLAQFDFWDTRRIGGSTNCMFYTNFWMEVVLY